MGGQMSKPSYQLSPHEKAVYDRAREFYTEEDYIQVCSEKADRDTAQLHSRRPQGVDPITSNEFIRRVLEDPKTGAHYCSSKRSHLYIYDSVANPDQACSYSAWFGEPTPSVNILTSQGSSGRCWLFASTNVFRIALMQKYGLESFELSQAYLFFWDKFEKANWFLEQIIDTSQDDIESRVVQQLLVDQISDGGQMSMVQGLVAKYGLVPKAIYPDNWNPMNSGVLNSILKTKLRQDALTLRKLLRGELAVGLLPVMVEGFKARFLQEVLTVMTLLLGPPLSSTESFSWEYTDKNSKAHRLSTSLREFARDIYGPAIRVNSETLDGFRLFMILVTSQCHSSQLIGWAISWEAVFFGCDVGQFSGKDLGVMDTELFDYQVGINTDMLGMGKVERLVTGESKMTHAMVLTAVHIDEATGTPIRWRVQNSWGRAAGDKGWFVMADAWMDEFVYQAVIDPRLCTRAVRDVLKQDPISLPLWDPMGSLA